MRFIKKFVKHQKPLTAEAYEKQISPNLKALKPDYEETK